MAKQTETKKYLLRLMSLHVLKHGLNAASLRPLAVAADTSDRMLIYHFGSKADLLNELLKFIAADLAARLDDALPTGPAKSNQSCISEIIALLRSPPYSDYMKLWFDVVSAAGHGNLQHATVGHTIIEGFLEWLELRLPACAEKPRQTACLMLTLIEGTLVMDSVGQSHVANIALDRLFANLGAEAI